MAVTRLAFQLTTNGSNYIDIAEQLSIHMRTLIRQKQTFTIVGGMMVDSTGTTPAKFTISTLPNTWYVKAAINRAFNAWKFSRNKLLEESATDDATNLVTGKYSDFKVWYNDGAYALYQKAIITGTQGTYPAGDRKEYINSEWDRATLMNEAGVSKDIKVLGDHTSGRYGALKGWLQSREIPNALSEPDMPDLDSDGVKDVSVDFITTLHGTADAQTPKLDILYDENDRSPFHTLQLLGGQDDDHNSTLQCVGYNSEVNPQSMIPGFKALCGLLHVQTSSEHSNPILFLDVMNTPERF